MVDKEGVIGNDEYGIINHPRTGYGVMPNHVVPTSDAGDKRAYDFWKHEGKILACSDPSLKLPLLPQIEEKAPILSQYKENQYWVQQGYKAASSKRFTEEDIRKAIFMSRQQIGVDWKYWEHQPEKIIQSLNPKPIKVEIEMVEYHFTTDKEGGIPVVPSTWLPKVDANNFVNVLRWIYE